MLFQNIIFAQKKVIYSEIITKIANSLLQTLFERRALANDAENDVVFMPTSLSISVIIIGSIFLAF